MGLSNRLIHEIRERDGISTRELAREVGATEEEFAALVDRLMELQEHGQLVRLPGRGWTLPERTSYRVGSVSLSRKGHAFVSLNRPDPAGDFFIPAGAVGGAFHGDLVLVEEATSRRRGRGRPSSRSGSGAQRSGSGAQRSKGELREGRVVDVVRRRDALVRGLFRSLHSGKGKAPSEEPRAAQKWAGFVRPIERYPAADIYVPADSAAGAGDGQKVFVRLLAGWSHGVHPRGEIVHAIADEGSYESDLRAIIAEFGLPEEIPQAALEEADALPATLGDDDLSGREDLRPLKTFTIDPEDARDFDDAVSIERLEGGGFRLGVHIADVSHYVRPGSRLDRMAHERGTSIYLPGRVVPMLPERISNDLASLRPREDRPSKTVFMEFDSAGVCRSRNVVRSVIHSARRFTYDEALAILRELGDAAAAAPPQRGPDVADDPALELPADHAEFAAELKAMAELRDALHRRRVERGCLELEIPSLRLRVNEHGDVERIKREQRDAAHHLIEEFMLAANEAVADYMSELGLPWVSRVHDEPDEEILKEFFEFLAKLDPRLAGGRRSEDLQRLIDEIRGEPYAGIANLYLLRSLSHAAYAAAAGLHFALGTALYCHFTSPIRRYPDLLIHQILDEHLTGKLGGKRKLHWSDVLPGLAVDSSRTEVRAEKAEREMTRVRLIRSLEPSVGERMTAVITSVHPFGLFVQVEDLLVDGFIRVSSLDDYYDHEPAEFCLRGRTTGIVLRVGDRIGVVLAEVDADLREVVFEFEGKLNGKTDDAPHEKKSAPRKRSAPETKHSPWKKSASRKRAAPKKKASKKRAAPKESSSKKKPASKKRSASERRSASKRRATAKKRPSKASKKDRAKRTKKRK